MIPSLYKLKKNHSAPYKSLKFYPSVSKEEVGTSTGSVPQFVICNSSFVINFTYNDRGQRLSKTSPSGTTHYVRDAAGSVLGIYFNQSLTEQPVYGNSRLGVRYRGSGKTAYQLSDHLGNVRAVVMKNEGNAISITNKTDYYPFGMPMPNRHTTDGDYRYAYQGQEKDKETGKEAFELRLWDSRIGRWLTTDPYGQYSSPYLGMGNDPVNRIDSDGGADNPVYDSKGNYKGNTVEGFTGEAIIYDGNIDFSGLTKDQLINNGGTYLSNFSFDNPFFRDQIESHIANFKLGDGLDIDGTISINSGDIGDALYKAVVNASNLSVIRGVDRNGNSIADRYYEPTVENIRNKVNLHEVGGHIFDGITSSSKHYLVVLKQINHKQFHITTDRFKGKTLQTLYDTNPNILNDNKLRELYYKIGYPYWIDFNKN